MNAVIPTGRTVNGDLFRVTLCKATIGVYEGAPIHEGLD